MAPTCPLGSSEAEEIYQRARKYRYGLGGYKRDKIKAKELLKNAALMGNSKAPLLIGRMYQYDFAEVVKEKDRYKFMHVMYELSAEMGCPDAYVFLAEAYDEGLGVKRDPKKAFEYLKKGVAQGSPKAMEIYAGLMGTDPRAPGLLISSDPKMRGLIKEMLFRSMNLGNGDAGIMLFWIYEMEKDINGMVKSLRDGARLGSKACIYELYIKIKNTQCASINYIQV
ncbi:MAG: sel1 repeat family protein [Candidatus Adiutrix sp.]|jgi:TPR repeat protein|nr:sel1 repeat family protein [Candidatus Adiutrix sp.]